MQYAHNSAVEKVHVSVATKVWEDETESDVVVLGGDGGAEMHDLIKAYYEPNGKKLGIAFTKTESDCHGTVWQLGAKYTLKRKANGKGQVAMLDRLHSKKAGGVQGL